MPTLTVTLPPLTAVDVYGAPNYGPGRMVPGRPEGWAIHTPENTDPSLTSAKGIAAWQASTGNTSGGSYHGIIGHEGTDTATTCTLPAHWTMVRSVPWNGFAGGISSNRDPAVWQPDRYPQLRQHLSAAAFADPNAYLHQISISGKAVQYANGYPLGLVTRLAQWLVTLENAYSYDALLTLHRHWQANRSDPGPLNLPDLLLAEYRRITATGTTPTPTPTPTDPRDAEITRLRGLVDRKNAALDAARAMT